MTEGASLVPVEQRIARSAKIGRKQALALPWLQFRRDKMIVKSCSRVYGIVIARNERLASRIPANVSLRAFRAPRDINFGEPLAELHPTRFSSPLFLFFSFPALLVLLLPLLHSLHLSLPPFFPPCLLRPSSARFSTASSCG